ncbi:hypothetical protein [Parvibaculum sp.]|uniref:hypothetical protein n=1 Tax=Parvibaculum sp. TaxID=2024848 RepID=UPI002C3959FF|nr:hypothetical protein [Parvibaculum sp.]HUD51781.1 hypothetical protein [Parvibaculum sp.]
MTWWKTYMPSIFAGLALLLAIVALALVLLGRDALIGRGFPKEETTETASGTPVNPAVPPAVQPATASPGATGAKDGPLQHMELEGQYAGPLKDTLIQRWRDPAAGMICYVYLPIVVEHSKPTPMGLVQYGANGIGSISCVRAQ